MYKDLEIIDVSLYGTVVTENNFIKDYLIFKLFHEKIHSSYENRYVFMRQHYTLGVSTGSTRIHYCADTIRLGWWNVWWIFFSL